MNSPPHTVVGLGEALWDVLPSGKHLGGAPLNFAYISSLLGENATIATRIGNDPLGAEIRTELSRRNLDLSGVQTDSELPTGTVEVSFRDGQPEYEIRRPVAWDALEWSPKWHELARKCDAVCFGSLAQRAPKSRITIRKFLENTRPECLKVFDINLRKPFYSREVIESALLTSIILKMNDLELREIASIFGVSAARMDQEMEALRRKFSLRAVLVTLGERGAMAVSQHGMVQHPGFTVKVSDTIGAGDAFSAAATHCILAEMSLEKTLAVANWWASWVASQAGGMPTMTEKQRREMRDVTAISA